MKTVVSRLALMLVVAGLFVAGQPAHGQVQGVEGGGSSGQSIIGSMGNNWDSGDFECAGTTATVPTLVIIPTVGPCTGIQMVLTFPKVLEDGVCTGNPSIPCLNDSPECDGNGLCTDGRCTDNLQPCVDNTPCGMFGDCTSLVCLDGTTPCVDGSDCLPGNLPCDVRKEVHVTYQIECEAGPPALLRNVGEICLCVEDCDSATHPACPNPLPFDEELTGEGVSMGAEQQSGPPFPVTLRIEKSATPGDILLRWTPDCFANENYGVYEGTLAPVQTGQYDHQPPPTLPTPCDDVAPINLAQFTPSMPTVSSYYLVVPNNRPSCSDLEAAADNCTQIEGSYGRQSVANPTFERAASASPCGATQVVGATCGN